MGVRNKKREVLQRLDSKTLDAKFLKEIQHGLNCSPFESQAVLEVVREVYFPFLDEQCVKAPPGKITLIAVSADEPAGKPVVECEKQSVCLTIHRGSKDDQILQQQGPAGFRQARILDLCQEALSQGALLTREDLAYRVFFVSPRTITRDLNILRTANPKLMIDDRPGWSQKIADTDLVPVVLDVSTPQDIQSRIDRVHPRQIRLHKAIRMSRQAYEQGGLLTNYDLSEILNIPDSLVGQLLASYERQNKTVVPRRGTIHDAGGSVSHKRIICHKRYVEGKSADQIARET